MAGGPNRRMGGESKALLPIGEGTLIERQVREMRKICSEIIVVTDNPRAYLRILDRDIRIITDFYHQKGPLIGIHAGLMLSTKPRSWIVGCDMPYINAKAAELLREAMRSEGGAQAAVPNVNGGVYPLHGLYDRSCAEAAVKLIEQGETSASALLRDVDWREVPDRIFTEAGVPLNFVMNINNKQDYEEVVHELGHSMKV